jgi:hypothetical protein
LEDVRYLYQTELPVAVRILEARTYQAQLQAAADAATGPDKAALQHEADVQAGIATGLSSSSPLATDPKYALEGGGFDLGKRLADLRAQNPDLVALDPDALQASGDSLAHKAEMEMLALLPISIAAFLAVMAQPFRRYRVVLLTAGAVLLELGAMAAIGVEVLS